MQDIPKKVTQILVDKLGIAESEITPDANFVKDLGIDSLDYAEIVMEFEQSFDIRIPDDDAEKLQTFGEAVKYIEGKSSASHSLPFQNSCQAASRRWPMPDLTCLACLFRPVSLRSNRSRRPTIVSAASPSRRAPGPFHIIHDHTYRDTR
ncbi:MAG: acyl carrier protein [Bacteroidia bacterium]|nr:acyl carrier protein [Bacteroidia bacterium]